MDFRKFLPLLFYRRLSILNTDFPLYPKHYCFFCFFFECLPADWAALFSFCADVCPPSLFQDEVLFQSPEGRSPHSLCWRQSEFPPRHSFLEIWFPLAFLALSTLPVVFPDAITIVLSILLAPHVRITRREGCSCPTLTKAFAFYPMAPHP